MQYYILHNGRYIRLTDKLVYENVHPFKKPTIHNAKIINETYLAFTLIYFIKKMRKMKSQNFVNYDMQKKSSLLGSKQYDAERDFWFLSWLYRDEKYSATSKL